MAGLVQREVQGSSPRLEVHIGGGWVAREVGRGVGRGVLLF